MRIFVTEVYDKNNYFQAIIPMIVKRIIHFLTKTILAKICRVYVGATQLTLKSILCKCAL
jgi:hypothetical protein